jgi:hypothetical protein
MLERICEWRAGSGIVLELTECGTIEIRKPTIADLGAAVADRARCDVAGGRAYEPGRRHARAARDPDRAHRRTRVAVALVDGREKMDELVASHSRERAHSADQRREGRRRFEVIRRPPSHDRVRPRGARRVPCIVYPSRDTALEAIKYAENRHREELSPADEAIWFSRAARARRGGDVDTLCAQLGEKRSYVEGRSICSPATSRFSERSRRARSASASRSS